MGANAKQILQEVLCVNTEKVYDWILGDSTGSTTIPVGDLPVTIPADAVNVNVRCFLTDAEGTPLPINTEVAVTETAPRQDRQFEVNGSLVMLQRVMFRKTIYVVLEVTGTDPATGTMFLITSDPVSFNFMEMAFLCAPVGTSLVVRISDFSCLAVINTDDTGDILSFGTQIFVCQSIQTIAPVTLELTADLCMPREAIVEQCPAPVIPPQCPTIFPG